MIGSCTRCRSKRFFRNTETKANDDPPLRSKRVALLALLAAGLGLAAAPGSAAAKEKGKGRLPKWFEPSPIVDPAATEFDSERAYRHNESSSARPVRIGFFHGGRCHHLYRTYMGDFFERHGVNVDLYTSFLYAQLDLDLTYKNCAHEFAWRRSERDRSCGRGASPERHRGDRKRWGRRVGSGAFGNRETAWWCRDRRARSGLRTAARDRPGRRWRGARRGSGRAFEPPAALARQAEEIRCVGLAISARAEPILRCDGHERLGRTELRRLSSTQGGGFALGGATGYAWPTKTVAGPPVRSPPEDFTTVSKPRLPSITIDTT